mmetsp:Transcript_58897/g.111107  ORF Transcript_58897/g.111107 Transcript_58897/m.111107 type:complete len:499 (+) Transcript_58897:40-1536(+)
MACNGTFASNVPFFGQGVGMGPGCGSNWPQELTSWCRDVAVQLANLSADVTALSRGLSETQQQVRDLSNGWRSTGPGAAQPLDELRDLRKSLADGLRNAELQASMAINRALADAACEAAEREKVLRQQLDMIHGPLRHECGVLGARAQRLEALAPELLEERRCREQELGTLNCHVQGMSSRIASIEAKGAQMARWLETEAHASKNAVGSLSQSVEAMKSTHTDLYDGLQECRNTLAFRCGDHELRDDGAPTPRADCAVVRLGSEVTATQLAEGLRAAEKRASEAIEKESRERAEALCIVRSQCERQQQLTHLVDELRAEQRIAQETASRVHQTQEKQHSLQLQSAEERQERRSELLAQQLAALETRLEASVRELRDEVPGACKLLPADENDEQEEGVAAQNPWGKQDKSIKFGRVVGVLVEPRNCSVSRGKLRVGTSQQAAAPVSTAWCDPVVATEPARSDKLLPMHELAHAGSPKCDHTPKPSRRWWNFTGTLPRRR